MADQQHPPLQRLRTFADDINRVKADRQLQKAKGEPSENKKPETNEVPAIPTNTTIIKVAPGLRIDPKKTAEDDKISALEAELNSTVADAEIPPFHYLRETSADESDYSDEQILKDEIKKSEKKYTPEPPAKPEEVLDIEAESERPTIPQPASLKNKKKEKFDTEDIIQEIEGGSIVTDQKLKRFKLFPAIGSAVTLWFKELMHTLATKIKPAPTQTVAKVDARENVIADAGQGSKMTPTDDHQTTIERLQQTERVVPTTGEITIKKAEETPPPTWKTPDTLEDTTTKNALEDLEAEIAPQPQTESEIVPQLEEAGIPNLPTVPDVIPELPTEVATPASEEVHVMTEGPAEEIQTMVEEPAVEATWEHFVGDDKNSENVPSETADTIPAPTPEPVAIPQPAEAVQEQVIIEAEPAPEVILKPVATTEITPETVLSEVSEPINESLIPEPAPYLTKNQSPSVGTGPSFNRTPVPSYRLNKLGKPVVKKQGTPYLTLAAVIIVAIILGTGVSVWFFTRDGDPIVVVTPTSSNPLVETNASTPLPLPSNRTLLYSQLQNTVLGGLIGTQEIYPTIGGIPTTPELVLSTMAISAPGSMQRAVTNITFGGYDASQPFIVMRFTSFDTMFGGMLTWEANMSEDLAPLFGPATQTQTLDSRVNNRDVRVLVTPNNDDVIVYGFIDKNTLLIAPDRTTFSAVAPLIR